MTDKSPLVPEWEEIDVPIADEEPEDAGVEHLASVEEVAEAFKEEE